MLKEITRSSLAVTAIAMMITGVLIIPSTNARATDAARGRLLYENECMVCHTSVVHVREDRKAKSRDEIRSWVQRWSKELKLQWESGEIDDVIEYLNDKYYHLKTTS